MQKYIIIPENILTNHELSAEAKLLYGDIAGLCQKEGYCWASNRYFATRHGANERSIKRWFSDLTKNGIITCDVSKGNQREIRCTQSLAGDIDVPVGDIDVTGEGQKCHSVGDRNVPHNNKENNTSNNMGASPQRDKKFITPTMEEVQKYCQDRNNSVDSEQFINFYSSKGWMIGKNKMKDWKAAVRTWEKSDYGSQSKTQDSKSKRKLGDL